MVGENIREKNRSQTHSLSFENIDREQYSRHSVRPHATRVQMKCECDAGASEAERAWGRQGSVFDLGDLTTGAAGRDRRGEGQAWCDAPGAV